MTGPFRLDGKTTLVTGANTGIGQAIALGLAGAGAEVEDIGGTAVFLASSARYLHGAIISVDGGWLAR